jgi:hypothetical protein
VIAEGPHEKISGLGSARKGSMTGRVEAPSCYRIDLYVFWHSEFVAIPEAFRGAVVPVRGYRQTRYGQVRKLPASSLVLSIRARALSGQLARSADGDGVPQNRREADDSCCSFAAGGARANYRGSGARAVISDAPHFSGVYRWPHRQW